MKFSAQPNQSSMAASAAFEAVYRAELKGVWAFLHRLGARGATLEDLAHDVFVTALRRFDRYEPSRPAGPWLRGIAWRLAADHRSLHRHQLEAAESDGLQAAASGIAPDEAVARRQAQAMLEEALGSLDFEKRTVFVMVDIEGHAVNDVAELMGAGVPTTHSRLRLARQAMSEALQRIRLRRGLS